MVRFTLFNEEEIIEPLFQSVKVCRESELENITEKTSTCAVRLFIKIGWFSIVYKAFLFHMETYQ